MAEEKSKPQTYVSSETVCQLRPECCKPRDIELVTWDADDTMWSISPYAIASNITGPLKMVDPDTVIAEEITYPSRHPYPTFATPKQAPKRKKKKRAWQRGFGEELPAWMTEDFGRGEGMSSELSSLADELRDSILGEPEELHEEPEEVVALDDVKGWAPRQQKHVDSLIKRYGKEGCYVVDVTPEKSVVIQCGDDIFMMTQDGQLIGDIPTKEPEPYKRTLTIKLLPTFRETVRKLKENGIKQAVISLNSPGSVKRIVDAFGMGEDFIEVQDTWKNKGEVFDEIAERQGVCPCNAMFVDNTLSHVKDVAKKCGLALQIGKGKDVDKPIEILNFIREKHAD